MLRKYFDKISGTHVSTYANDDWLRRTVSISSAQVRRYYMYSNHYIKTEHLLVRFLRSLDLPIEKSKEAYLNHAKVQGMQLSKVFQFTSPLQLGVLHDDVLYNGKHLIYTFKGSSNNQVSWYRRKPIRLIYTRANYLDFPPLHGILPSTMTIISINLIDLMSMYYEYKVHRSRLNSLYRKVRPDLPISAGHFINTMILPSLSVDSFLSTITNNIIKPKSREKANIHPFTLREYTKEFDEIIENYRQNVVLQGSDYNTALVNYPNLLYKQPNGFLSYKLPFSTFNTISRLVAYLMRLDHMYSYIHLDREGFKQSNGSEYYYLTRFSRLLKRDNQMKTLVSAFNDTALEERFNYFL